MLISDLTGFKEMDVGSVYLGNTLVFGKNQSKKFVNIK